MKPSQIILFAMLLLIVEACNLKKENKIEAKSNIERVADSVLSVYKFNGNILIAKKGEIIYKKNIGFSNMDTKEALNDSSLFELASVSKQFTSMAIMMLKEDGKLDYSDNVKKYIPEVPYEGITIRHLLTHISGLPEYEEFLPKTWDHSKIAFNNDVIEAMHKYKPALLFKPGEKWQYSNTGYAVLASVIERVSGKKYGEFLAERIFIPLKMTHTRTYNTRRSGEVIANYAYGYVYSDSLKKYVLPDSVKQLHYVYYLDGIVGDGVVNSTIVDLYKWDRALYTSLLVKPTTLREALIPARLNNSTTHDYGFGWAIKKDSLLGNIYAHSGGWPGYHTYILRVVDHDTCIILLSNNQVDGLSDIIKTLGRAIFPRKDK